MVEVFIYLKGRKVLKEWRDSVGEGLSLFGGVGFCLTWWGRRGMMVGRACRGIE